MRTAGTALRAALCALGASFPFSVAAQSYVGFGFASAHGAIPSLDTTRLGAPVTAAPDKTRDTGFKFYGGHQFTPNWGVEVGVAELGRDYSARITVSGAPARTQSGSLSTQYVAATATLPVGKRFSLFGKIGLAANQFSSHTSCAAFICVQLRSENRTSPMFGVGIQYRLAQKLGLRLEYEDYGEMTGDGVWGAGSSGAIKGNSWYLGAQLMF